MSYIELHAASAFSFLQGASLPEALVDRAAELDYPALALLDRDGVYGLPRFHKAARAAGIRPIVGAELTITGHVGRVGQEGRPHTGPVGQGRQEGLSRVLRGRQSHQPDQPYQPFPLSLLCASQEGYRNLCRLITQMKLSSPTSLHQGYGGPPELQRRRKGEGALPIAALDGMTGGLVAIVGRAALDADRFGVGGLLDRIVGLFGRERTYVEVQRHYRREEESDNQALVAMAEAFRVPLLATNGARFASPADRPLFDVLTCIHHHTDLAQAGRRLAPNAERYLKSPAQMAALFADHPRAVTNTLDLAERLQFTMADLGYRFPEYPVPSGETQASFLRRITDVGARNRYRPYHDKARAQIARELDLIEKLDLAGYFLIVWDIVNYCRQHDILVQGRGSAANSAVCYSLGITAVDPVGMDLLFERFLSEERGEWPDIDLDLPSGDRRERVIQHVYEKYGKHGAAMTANVITYRGRSAAREVGKVLGFDGSQVDRLAKVMNHFEFVDTGDTLNRHLASVGLDLNANRVRLFAKLWQEMQDLPRHLGQHSGGMVICQGRLDSVVPLENASMPGRVVVQWDKDDCADMGIVKVDLLGLGMMAAIQDALALVNGPARAPEMQIADWRLQAGDTHRQEPSAQGLLVDLAHLPENDPAVYRMLQEADTIGVFQVESRAQMATLPRLKPAKFYDLVVQVAIIRPGPIVGQMVHPYLNRRAGREAVVYAHPSLEPVLARTLGVPLFQEQLLRMAMVVAGFTGGQAEELRRAMGFKRSEKRMKQIELQLREGMAKNGIAPEAMEQIILSITSFALYGFPESHAASFALLAYASAYLKAHYPSAFYTALLNNQPMGFYHPSTLVKDAQRHGVRFQPIDVQVSGWDCTVEPDGAVRLGLRYVNGLRAEAGKAIAASAEASRRRTPGATYTETRATSGTTANATLRSAHLQVGHDGRGLHQPDPDTLICPKCGCDDPTMLERVEGRGAKTGTYYCNNCSHDWVPGTRRPLRFASLDELVARIGLRRDEVVTLADIGALNAFGYDRRAALWQAERAVRPAGALFSEEARGGEVEADSSQWLGPSADLELAQAIEQVSEDFGGEPDGEPVDGPPEGGHYRPRRSPTLASGFQPLTTQGELGEDEAACPLKPMTEAERLVADYAGTGLTVGRHPIALRRHELAMRGVMRAVDIRTTRQGRMVRVAGMVITRQRPGTAKGFVFLTLEDETGIANIIVRPDLFARDRAVIVEEPFLLVEGVLQNQDGVVSIRAEIVQGLGGTSVDFDAHDFY